MVSGVEQLRRLNKSECDTIVNSIPAEWDVSVGARQALARLVYERALFVADNIVDCLEPICWPQQKFEVDRNGDG